MRRAAALAGAALVAQLVAVAGRAAEDEDAYVRIPGTRVSLKRPAGMHLSRTFAGIETRDGTVFVTVTELHRSWAQTSEDFEPEALAQAGIRVLARGDVEIGGQPGFIAYLAEGPSTAIWLAVFGDDVESVVVRGSAPAARAKQVNDKIHEILVSAKWERERAVDPFQGLGYRLAGKLPLRFAARIGSDLYFTRDGAVRTTSAQPELVVGQRAARVPAPKRNAFCKTAFEQVPGVEITAEPQQADVQIDGLAGCEMMAAGQERTTKADLLVYQVILFDADGHYLFRGRTGWAQRLRFTELMTESVRAFKRRT